VKRHLTAAVIAAATSGACLLAFGTGWWSVAFAAANAPIAYVSWIRYRRAIEGGDTRA
jgi:hypothetical protein